MSAKSILLLLLCLIIVIFFFIFITPGFEEIKHLIELGPVTGVLNVAGVAPQVILVYAENSYCDEPGGPAQPRVDATQDSYRQIRFNATVFDVNGDCDGNATFYICANETAVPPTYCDENYRVDSPIPATLDAKYGGTDNNLYCNYSATYSLPYFRRCGNWYINVTAFDREGKSNNTVRWWKDNLLSEVWYPYDTATNKPGGIIYMGTVNLGQWNFNMGYNTTKNVGNTNITSIEWNATDFKQKESPYDVIPIIPKDGNTTFAIDDDQDIVDGAGYINDDPSVKIPFPSYGLYRCEDEACTSTRAKYDLWWHIFVPSGIQSGIYENVIQYDITPMSCE
jgi:hypothetical protein